MDSCRLRPDQALFDSQVAQPTPSTVEAEFEVPLAFDRRSRFALPIGVSENCAAVIGIAWLQAFMA